MLDQDIAVSTPRRATPVSALGSMRIGPLTLPVYAAAALVTGMAIYTGKLPNDIIGGLSVLMLGGFLLAKVGQTVPVLKDIGGTAILCLFVPSALVGYGLMPPVALKAITTTFKTADFQYFYIACLVAGSILGMPHRVLVQGFIRMFVPLLVGTCAALAAGVAIGLLFGHTPKDTFFFILVPIFGGGLAEGTLPLSVAYAQILHRPQTDLIALMVPGALVGNVVAIVASGLLARLGQKRPDLSGDGMLVKSGEDNELLKLRNNDASISLPLLGAGIILSCGLFIFGMMMAPVTGIPGPILMIISAAILKVTGILPEEMELGAYQINKFMSANLTFAILAAMGAVLVNWHQLLASFNIGYIGICAGAVLAMIASGFFVGKAMNMYPIEAAVVTACHSGLGGTGDVAILGAADRMGLMAFAQISTRVGGAIMIVVATFLMKAMS